MILYKWIGFVGKEKLLIKKMAPFSCVSCENIVLITYKITGYYGWYESIWLGSSELVSMKEWFLYW